MNDLGQVLVTAGVSDHRNLWQAAWFLVAIAVFALLTLVGVYVLAAVYFSLPLPEPRAPRRGRGRLPGGERPLRSHVPCHQATPPRPGNPRPHCDEPEEAA